MSSVTVARDRLTGYLMKGEAARFNDADFDQVLIHAMDMEASDVYFKTSRPVVARVHGRLVASLPGRCSMLRWFVWWC